MPPTPPVRPDEPIDETEWIRGLRNLNRLIEEKLRGHRLVNPPAEVGEDELAKVFWDQGAPDPKDGARALLAKYHITRRDEG